MTPAEVAAMLRVSTATVRRLCADRSLRSVSVGRQLRIHADSVDAYLER